MYDTRNLDTGCRGVIGLRYRPFDPRDISSKTNKYPYSSQRDSDLLSALPPHLLGPNPQCMFLIT
jgi:hypothetical protein